MPKPELYRLQHRCPKIGCTCALITYRASHRTSRSRTYSVGLVTRDRAAVQLAVQPDTRASKARQGSANARDATPLSELCRTEISPGRHEHQHGRREQGRRPRGPAHAGAGGGPEGLRGPEGADRGRRVQGPGSYRRQVRQNDSEHGALRRRPPDRGPVQGGAEPAGGARRGAAPEEGPGPPRARRPRRQAREDAAARPSSFGDAFEDEEEEAAPPPKRPTSLKCPDVDTAFLPDAARDAAKAERRQAAAEWLAAQEEAKKAPLQIARLRTGTARATAESRRSSAAPRSTRSSIKRAPSSRGSSRSCGAPPSRTSCTSRRT